MLEASIFTWSEPLGASFAAYVADSHRFKANIIHNRWVLDINMLERVAKDEVIRGYFSDTDDS